MSSSSHRVLKSVEKLLKNIESNIRSLQFYEQCGNSENLMRYAPSVTNTKWLNVSAANRKKALDALLKEQKTLVKNIAQYKTWLGQSHGKSVKVA